VVIRSNSRACAITSLALLLSVVGCSSGRSAGGSGTVRVTGRIGTLQLDRSDRADVIAFAGRPDAERENRKGPGFARYDALGYGCVKTRTPDVFPLAETTNGPYCRTIFFIAGKSGKLGTFFTTSARYSEGHGVHIRTLQARAERLLHQRLVVGCETNLYVSSPAAMLTIAFEGGVERLTSVKGAHVYAFVLHSRQRDAGVFDCM
jgi:hypothetical protein